VVKVAQEARAARAAAAMEVGETGLVRAAAKAGTMAAVLPKAAMEVSGVIGLPAFPLPLLSQSHRRHPSLPLPLQSPLPQLPSSPQHIQVGGTGYQRRQHPLRHPLPQLPPHLTGKIGLKARHQPQLLPSPAQFPRQRVTGKIGRVLTSFLQPLNLHGEIGLVQYRLFPSRQHHGQIGPAHLSFRLFPLQLGVIGALQPPLFLPFPRQRGVTGVPQLSRPFPPQPGETGVPPPLLPSQKQVTGPTGPAPQRLQLLLPPAACGTTGRQVHLPQSSLLPHPHQSPLLHQFGPPRSFNQQHQLLLP
jgi:hypothetical protein